MSTPIYYVIVESKPIPPALYQCWQIIQVFACYLDDIDHLYKHDVVPLIQDGRNVQSMMFHREPPNMFREQAVGKSPNMVKEQAIEKSVWDI